jgi:hypothetical protein
MKRLSTHYVVRRSSHRGSVGRAVNYSTVFAPADPVRVARRHDRRIRHHLRFLLVRSHLHESGHVTLLSAGSVLAAYINFGISASHLLSASVMSAPAALAYSKLFYPETEESRTKVDNIVTDERYLKVEFNLKNLIKFRIKEWHFFPNGRR